MTPISVHVGPEGGQIYGSPFVGPIDHPAPVRVDPSTLFGSDWLDERGYLKPGTPFTRDGVIAGGADTVAYGMLIEATEVVKIKYAGGAVSQAALDAQGDRNFIVGTICQFNQDLLEDIVGRVLSAGEIAAFDANAALVRI